MLWLLWLVWLLGLLCVMASLALAACAPAAESDAVLLLRPLACAAQEGLQGLLLAGAWVQLRGLLEWP